MFDASCNDILATLNFGKKLSFSNTLDGIGLFI